MTGFVIVIAAATAMLATPLAPAPDAAASAAPGAAASIPPNAPTVGFRVYSDAASCEQATAVLTAPPGARLVCVPIEPMVGEMANAY
jgi:uncharacterized caspase-like protein